MHSQSLLNEVKLHWTGIETIENFIRGNRKNFGNNSIEAMCQNLCLWRLDIDKITRMPSSKTICEIAAGKFDQAHKDLIAKVEMTFLNKVYNPAICETEFFKELVQPNDKNNEFLELIEPVSQKHYKELLDEMDSPGVKQFLTNLYLAILDPNHAKSFLIAYNEIKRKHYVNFFSGIEKVTKQMTPLIVSSEENFELLKLLFSEKKVEKKTETPKTLNAILIDAKKVSNTFSKEKSYKDTIRKYLIQYFEEARLALDSRKVEDVTALSKDKNEQTIFSNESVNEMHQNFLEQNFPSKTITDNLLTSLLKIIRPPKPVKQPVQPKPGVSNKAPEDKFYDDIVNSLDTSRYLTKKELEAQKIPSISKPESQESEKFEDIQESEKFADIMAEFKGMFEDSELQKFFDDPNNKKAGYKTLKLKLSQAQKKKAAKALADIDYYDALTGGKIEEFEDTYMCALGRTKKTIKASSDNAIVPIESEEGLTEEPRVEILEEYNGDSSVNKQPKVELPEESDNDSKAPLIEESTDSEMEIFNSLQAEKSTTEKTICLRGDIVMEVTKTTTQTITMTKKNRVRSRR